MASAAAAAAAQCWSEKPQTWQATSTDHSCIIWPSDVYSVLSCLQSEPPLVFDVCSAASREAAGRQTCLCSPTTRQDGQITQRLKLQPENALIICRDWDFVASTATALHPPPWENRAIVWYDSSTQALIQWPVLLCVCVWVQSGQSLSGRNWLYWKRNQRGLEATKVQSVVEQTQAVYSGISLWSQILILLYNENKNLQ